MRSVLSMLTLLALIAAIPAFAQSDALKEAWQRTDELNSAGKYADAESWAKKAVDLAKAEFGTNSVGYASSVEQIAGLYLDQGRYDEAEPYDLIVGNAEINALVRSLTASAKLAQPLMRHDEISEHRHGKYGADLPAGLYARASDSRDILFRSEMNQKRHGKPTLFRVQFYLKMIAAVELDCMYIGDRFYPAGEHSRFDGVRGHWLTCI